MKIYWTGKSKNIIGKRIREIRTERNMTTLAQRLQLAGFDFTELTILHIENGTRFVPDYEVKALAEVLKVSYAELLDKKEPQTSESP